MDKINLPETLDVDPTTWEFRQTTPTLTTVIDPPEPSPEELVHLLHSSSHREYALSKLAKEVMSAYRLLPPSDRRVTARESTRTCNAIALFQIDNPEDGQQIVHYLLESEVFPLFLSCMDHGDEPTQTVSALIIAKILWRAEGLKYCSAYGERFFALVRALGRVVDRQPAERPSLGLLRSVIACYLRLSEVPRAKDAFRNCIPARMTQHNFIAFIRYELYFVEKHT
nr:cell differentiation protein RCD1 homolog [Ipomoea batatas]